MHNLKGFHGPVQTKYGGVLVDGDGPPTANDMREIEAFQRFLQLAPPPGEEMGWIRRRALGWLPYVLGVGPAPPEGMDDVGVPAWTFPA